MKILKTTTRDMMSDKKQSLFDECRAGYKRLLPDVKSEDLEEALEECYEEGMSGSELTKLTYSFLHPVKEPSLW